MKTYHGWRDDDGACHVAVRVPGERVRALNPRLGLRRHSPTGFEWGYGGSGPAQLALALVADVLGDDHRAVLLYQAFKWKVIAKLDRHSPWSMTDAEILATVEEIAVTDIIRRKAKALGERWPG